MTETIIIVGASHAAAQAIDTLRREGLADRIVLIGAEPYLPYQRPPLSKKYLLGELAVDRLAIRRSSFYDDQKVEVHLDSRAVEIDTNARTVRLSSGEELSYAKMILCVGSRVRRLICPGAELQGVHYVRTIDDIDRLRADLQPDKRMIVIGAGYIGLETAAAARQLGLQVTVLEMAERCLQRVTSPLVSEFFAQRHAQAGVEIRTQMRVAEVIGDRRVRAVRCADATELPTDVVVVGVGITPETELAQAAGLNCDNGIVVDEHCRTSDPHIFAAGDCTSHPSLRYGGRVRLESVDNAIEQARVAANNICGRTSVHAHTPWFWSDQYEIKLQTAGLLHGYTEQILRGAVEARQFSVWYLRNDEILAVDAINRPADFMTGKRWIGERKHIDSVKLADVSCDLKSL